MNFIRISLQIVIQIQPREGIVTRNKGDRNKRGHHKHLSSEHETAHMHILAVNVYAYVGVSAERATMMGTVEERRPAEEHSHQAAGSGRGR